MKTLICHIHEDTPIAQVLQDWTGSTFAGQSEVFVHSDDEIILSDAAWLEKIDEALEGSKALVLVISPTSLQKPWVNFELGCAWMKGIFILPVCHSGITVVNLPQPLSMFQGLDLNQEDFPEMFITLLGKELGIRKLPRINFAEMAGEIRKAQEAMQPMGSEKKEIPPPVIEEDRRLGQTYEQILLILANADTVGYTAAVLADHFKIQEPKMKFYLKKLTEDKYLYASYPGAGQSRYNLTHKGKAYLEEYGLI